MPLLGLVRDTTVCTTWSRDERFVGDYDHREFDPMAVTRALSDLRLEYETDEV